MRRQGGSDESMGGQLKKRGLKPTYSVDSLPGEVPDESAQAPAGGYNNKFFDQGGAYSGIDHGMKVKLSEALAKRGSSADREAFAHKFYDEGGEFSGLDHDMKGQILGEWGDGPDSEPDGDPDDPAAALLAKKKAILARRMAEKQARQGRRAIRQAPIKEAEDPTLSTNDPNYDKGWTNHMYRDPNSLIKTGDNVVGVSGGAAVPRGVGAGSGGGQMDPAKIQQIMQYLQMMGMR